MKTPQILKLAAAAAGLTLSGSALADGPGWTYGQLGYLRADSSETGNTGGDIDAIVIEGSLGFAERWHGQLTYLDGTAEGLGNNGGDLDGDGVILFVGAHPELSANTDLVIDAQLFDASFDAPGGGDFDCDGFGVRTGLRSMQFDDRLELNAFATWTDGSCDGIGGGPDTDFTDVGGEFGGQYFWTPAFSTGISYTIDGPAGFGADTFEFNIRYNFVDVF